MIGRPTDDAKAERQARILPPAPLGKLPPQPWMEAAETQQVLRALAADGAEVRFIGGCVRDAILKRPVHDIDLALARRPDQVVSLLQRAGIKAVPTGIDHGTVTALLGAMQFEITSLRVDVESFGRRARIAYTDDWIADAARRDFTFNALSSTPNGDIYDYFDGMDDLAYGRVRFVGKAEERIGEDVLRLLRFFRFYAWYGRPPIDQGALIACRDGAEKISMLSGERVRGEVFRTLMAPDPGDVFDLMRTWRVLEHVLPEAKDTARLKMLSWLDTRAIRLESVTADPLRRLGALITQDKFAATRIADRLKLSNRQRERLSVMMSEPGAVNPDADADTIARALYRLGAEAARDQALLSWAGELCETPRAPQGRNARWIDLLQRIDSWQPVAFPLKGRDAQALGLAAGPGMGALLKEVQAWWENDGCRAGYDACLEHLGTLIRARQ
ncbi:MAG: CCA tRNA nucleotidyltransferase [Rhodospirillales bacterium]|nr:CCA tRNA nucleotidyltransferase [Rhodospirillales bacterium]